MRKTLVLLALIASSALFLAATPTPANAAANCADVWASTTWWDGQLNFGAYIHDCTNVSMVQYVEGNGGPGSGWFDASDQTPAGPYKYATSTYGPAIQYIYSPATQTSRAYKRNSWCGGANHVVQPFFQYRIRNSTWGYPGSWGSWQTRWGPVHNILC